MEGKKEKKEKRLFLPQLFQDHMMLQREKPLRFYGEADEMVWKVSVEYTSKTGEISERNGAEILPDGQFLCSFPSLPADVGGTLRFYINDESEPEIILTDVCVGDIWVAAGQSNMEYFLRYDAHWNDIKKESIREEIRMYNVPRIAYEGQERNLPGDGYWFLQGDPAWAVFSAPGYCFARSLQEKLKVPVGVIGCNWGGTSASAWMEKSYLEQPPLSVYLSEYEEELRGVDPEELYQESRRCWEFEDSYAHELEWRTMMYGQTWEEQQTWMKMHQGDPVLPIGPYHHYRPCGLYDRMLKKVAPFPVKGILWYQGESDEVHADLYALLMEKLIQCFRDAWMDEQLPFLYVQLAPFERWLECRGDRYPQVRACQELVSKKVANVWMTSISDLGDRDDIHPKFKREVGERLALLARGKIYGEELLCEPPECTGAEAAEEGILLSFAHTEGGIVCGPLAEQPFVVTKDGEKADVSKVEVKGEQLLIKLKSAQTSSAVSEKTKIWSISFAETPYYEVQIWNQAGLPLKPFHKEVNLAE